MRIQRLGLLLPFVLAAPLASAAPVPAGPAGNLLRVGPTQAFTTIQGAVAAALPGDLILVDPGSYGEFAVDGKGISIAPADGSSFTVLESVSLEPAILVENLPADQQVSIVGALIRHGTSHETPAVWGATTPARCASAPST